ncbi:hypothetical protein AMAG_09033 [Allomyces macrogynus ATCC 38327]|uniref:GH15-like domain-containing protein n=1 Tax=Allomyces macrogynus (strain ATCC 38327) TaxID=578462 RepID=A0A0L0SN79_ALLM3|nr:hypothetical protein AMAG_09033 [Allomyces macrogynus ATCC 38327]|eukprot:KNE63971.1 hypothetical protein AMAG_09033 [Allomyces macrogynus ATCC 38327]
MCKSKRKNKGSSSKRGRGRKLGSVKSRPTTPTNAKPTAPDTEATIVQIDAPVETRNNMVGKSATLDANALAATLAAANVVMHNPTLAELVKDTYTHRDQVAAIRAILNKAHALDLPLIQGRALFQAALHDDTSSEDYTGYTHTWVRDTIHIAHARYVLGDAQVAAGAVTDLARFWLRYRHRWDACLRNTVDFRANAMERPHIRFDGNSLSEIDQTWAHAQNDALGYTLWLASLLTRNGHFGADLLAPLPGIDTLPSAGSLADMLALLILYAYRVEYWHDNDSGHWEEARKVEASSVGAMVAGLRDWHKMLAAREAAGVAVATRMAYWASHLDVVGHDKVLHPLADQMTRLAAATTEPAQLDAATSLVAALESQGRAALAAILPYESRTPGHERATDAALLFLVYPMHVVDDAMAAQIVTDVVRDLAGDHGIRRYRGDSYWMADYKALFDESTRTADFSDDMGARNALLKPGQEAQWCIFDAIVACICGDWARSALERGDRAAANTYRALQTRFFNRAVGQTTGPDCAFGTLKCPESYYLEKGKYVVNDVCPLLWTQANLIKALDGMERTIAAFQDAGRIGSVAAK